MVVCVNCQRRGAWYDEPRKVARGTCECAGQPALSPDGNRAAFDINGSKARNIDVRIPNLRNGGRFTRDETVDLKTLI